MYDLSEIKNANDYVDERLDFYQHEKSSISNTQLEIMFNHLSVSPPLSLNENDVANMKHDFTSFKEDIMVGWDEELDEKLNFYGSVEDSLTPIPSPLIHKEKVDKEGISWMNESPLEESPVNSTYIMETQEISNAYDYHMNFVNYYKNAILRQIVSPDVIKSIESTLPDSYKHYLQCIKKSYSIPSNCL